VFKSLHHPNLTEEVQLFNEHRPNALKHQSSFTSHKMLEFIKLYITDYSLDECAALQYHYQTNQHGIRKTI